MTAIRSALLRSANKNVTDSFVCDVSAAVGDLVRASKTVVDGVDVASNNSLKEPVIGIILSKPSTTLAKVMLLGQVDYSTGGLTKGQQIFLSNAGVFTSTVPTTGYFQLLGVAVNTDKVLFNPQYRVVKRSA